VIDSHAHLTSIELLPEVDAIVQRALDAGVEKIINICTDQPSLEAGIKLSERFSQVYNTAATTPHDVEKDGAKFFPYVEKAARAGQLVALGETGLDYFYEHSPKALQQAFLSRYFALGQKVDLPVVFHCRDAFEDLFAIADKEWKGKSALLHCFTGTLEEARGVLDRGWYLSLSGIVTYKKSEELREVAKFVSLDRLVIETDSPYLAPQSRRGRQNEPAFVRETAEKIAEVKKLPVEEVIHQTAKNASQFFNLK
jgi:TatD DNase family protein